MGENYAGRHGPAARRCHPGLVFFFFFFLELQAITHHPSATQASHHNLSISRNNDMCCVPLFRSCPYAWILLHRKRRRPTEPRDTT